MEGSNEENGTYEAVATITNPGGTRTIRFETGRLARQAAGSAVAYLDDETMILSATTASKRPKDQLDFFPLTVDVEERMYSIGKIPGSFFRREGRPSEDAILTCRLIDRPLRPSFVKGLRNEIQIVCTILSLNPRDLYDVVAINAASASTMLAGLPFSGPIGATRVALIEGQWVAFPTHEELERATFDMVVAGRELEGRRVRSRDHDGRGRSHRRTIELIAGGATAPTEEVVAAGLEAAKAPIGVLCAAQRELASKAAKETGDFPLFHDYEPDVLEAVTAAVRTELAAALQIAGKLEREQELDRVKALAGERVGRRLRGPREGDQPGLPVADQDPGARAGHPRQGPHRRPRPHRHPGAVGRGRRAPAGARVGALRARRDPDPGRHDAGDAAHGADHRHAQPGQPQALHAQLQLPAVLDR